MSLKSQSLHIEEKSGNRYPDMATAQRLALAHMANGLAEMVRNLIDIGELTVENGRVIISQSTEIDNHA